METTIPGASDKNVEAGRATLLPCACGACIPISWTGRRSSPAGARGCSPRPSSRGLTRGYRHHPQLDRFRALPDPVAGVATYLHALADEAGRRGYAFDRSRLAADADPGLRLPVTESQLRLEFDLLRAKVAGRDPGWLPRLDAPRPHPLFVPVPGGIAPWERAARPDA